MLKDKRKGDTVYYIPHSTKDHKIELTVTKVTSEFIYAEATDYGRASKYKFNLDNAYEVVKFGGGGRVFESEQDYLDSLEKIQLIKDITLNLKSVSLEGLKAIYRVVKPTLH